MHETSAGHFTFSWFPVVRPFSLPFCIHRRISPQALLSFFGWRIYCIRNRAKISRDRVKASDSRARKKLPLLGPGRGISFRIHAVRTTETSEQSRSSYRDAGGLGVVLRGVGKDPERRENKRTRKDGDIGKRKGGEEGGSAVTLSFRAKFTSRSLACLA